MKNSAFNYFISRSAEEEILVNTLSGAIDIVPAEYGRYLREAREEDNEIKQFLAARMYLLENEMDEEEAAAALYAQIRTLRRRQSPLKCLLILTFDCNLRCAYCWQQHRVGQEKAATFTRDKVELALSAVKELADFIREKNGRPPVIQLFGGEPLLKENFALVGYTLKRCADLQYDTHITTNGVDLPEFQESILQYGVKEIQVTVDGTEEWHNRRRVGSEYKKIMSSLDNLISKDALHVKLRVNVDDSNIESLYGLANEIIDRRWYTCRRFYAYLAPLRDSSLEKPVLIKRRRKLLEKLFLLKERHPQIEVFDILGWDGYQPVRALEKSGRLPYPKSYICDVNLNQFVFTPDGGIHLCAEEAHGTAGLIGSYSPQFSMCQEGFDRLYNKSCLALSRCRSCNMLPLCGGGCLLVAQQPKFQESYCTSVRECFEYGLRKYLEGGCSVEDCAG